MVDNWTPKWPPHPLCHPEALQRWGQTTWRPANEKKHPSNDRIEPFRSCSYCGGIHPHDLLNAIEQGATLGGADWKYGWPHKFYIEGIPDPRAGERRSCGSISLGGDYVEGKLIPRTPTPEQKQQYEGWHLNEHGTWSGTQYAPAPATTHGKWYNAHFQDFNDASTFLVVSEAVYKATHIKFDLSNDGKLTYKAPFRGFQAGYHKVPPE